MPKKEKKDEPQPVSGTVTCSHCRYEYSAEEPRCTICGYPWPWLDPKNQQEKDKPNT